MKTWKIVFLVILGRTAAIAVDAARLQNPQVSVCVYNDAGVSAQVLRKAKDKTTDLFRRSSISLDLMDCAEHAGPRQGADAEYYVHIIPAATTLSDEAFGAAFLSSDGNGCYADVFFNSLKRLRADQSNAGTAEILGYVMAHEIGHLFLGLDAHSRVGIMEPRWSGSELQSIAMGKLTFTPDQARRLFQRAEFLNRAHELATSKAVAFEPRMLVLQALR